MCEILFTGSVPNVMTLCDGKQGFCRRKTALSEFIGFSSSSKQLAQTEKIKAE
jgi:hypothetical protein